MLSYEFLIISCNKLLIILHNTNNIHQTSETFFIDILDNKNIYFFFKKKKNKKKNENIYK